MADAALAVRTLNRVGSRIIDIHGRQAIGLWSDLDGPDVREALRILQSELPVRYLDGAGIPLRYKVRQAPGEPVPAHVLQAMQETSSEPWLIRDEMLRSMKKSKSASEEMCQFANRERAEVIRYLL